MNVDPFREGQGEPLWEHLPWPCSVLHSWKPALISVSGFGVKNWIRSRNLARDCDIFVVAVVLSLCFFIYICTHTHTHTHTHTFLLYERRNRAAIKREGRPGCFKSVLVLKCPKWSNWRTGYWQEGREDSGADALGNLKPGVQRRSAKNAPNHMFSKSKQIQKGIYVSETL